MKISTKLSYLVATTALATGMAFAQGIYVQGGGGASNNEPPQGGGFFGRFMHGYRPEDGGQQPGGPGPQDDEGGRRDGGGYGMGRPPMMATSTMMMATSTKWGEFREDMKGMREQMRGRVASLTDEQVSSIAVKLGITIDALKAQLATGTPLWQIIGNKISREEMLKIIPPPVMSSTTASGTMMFRGPRGEHMGEEQGQGETRRNGGFFNTLRAFFQFGAQGNIQDNNAQANVNADANAQVGGENQPPAPPMQGLGNFFRRLFNF